LIIDKFPAVIFESDKILKIESEELKFCIIAFSIIRALYSIIIDDSPIFKVFL
jgi:hypothetical protein